MKPNLKTSLKKKSRASAMPHFSTMLILQQDNAWWLKAHDNKIVDYQRFELDAVSDIAATECLVPRWRHDESQHDLFYVDLVLDTTIDEVDRVGVRSSGSKIIDCYRQQKTLKRLWNDYPHACVYPLPSHTEERAALMHPVVPDAWSDWMLRVQACNVVIQRAVTSTQLGCHWSSRFSDYVLLNMRSASRSRHILIKDGAAHFLRTMRVLSEERVALQTDEVASKDNLSELDRTIEYIRSHTSLAAQPVFIVEPICTPTNILVESHGHENMQVFSGNTTQSLTQTLSSSVYCLFSMFHDQAVHYRSRLEMSKALSSVDIDKGNYSDVEIELKAPRFACVVVSSFIPRSVIKWFSSWAATRRTKNRWQLITQTLRWAHYLQPSMRHVKTTRQQSSLYKLSILMLCSVVIAASVTTMNGLAGYRAIGRNDVERLGASRIIEQPVLALSQLRVPLSFAADSLFMMDELSRESQLDATFLLTSIARVISAAPEITIDRLAWISLENNELFETLTHGSMAVVPRASVVEEDIDKGMQVQIEGVVSVSTLAHQKNKFDSFLRGLEKLPSIREVRILESPLDSAMSSGAQINEVGRFRLALLLADNQ